MIHYHGTPITPQTALFDLRGRCFCVSFGRPDQVRLVQGQSQTTMFDNGAWKLFNEDRKAGRDPTEREWSPFYPFLEEWMRPSDWAVIPDVIGGGSQLQDALIKEWPFGHRGAPVWHLDEPIHRLMRLCDEWPRVCMGSTEEYFDILSPAWVRRMDEAWNAIARVHQRFLPNVHMLRGMQLSGRGWPFASVDSTDIAQNHNRPQNTPRKMADRWDAMQTPWKWEMRPEQLELVA